MKIILDIADPDPEESPEELLERATKHEQALRAARNAARRETARLRDLWKRGLLRPTITPEEHARLHYEFTARGGVVTRCVACTARGAHTSPFWDVDRSALVPGVREIELTRNADGYYEAVEDGDDE